MQAVLPENIERIEVISGPGATLWGANAVNGVINIITRSSADTQGGVLTLDAGNLERGASLQYGGRLAPDLTYRVHVEGTQFSAYQLPNGQAAEDRWATPQGGFRLDWTPTDNSVSVQGDIFWGYEQPNENTSGRDVMATWRHQFADGSSVQLLSYYDQATRYVPNGGGGFTLNTYDIEAQHNFSIGERNAIVWGVGERNFNYVIENTALQLIPSSQTLNLVNVFGQDTISITDRVKLTLGLKLEDEPYVGLEVMPSIRASWKVVDSTLLWAAISRAVRSPTPVDENLREYGGAVDFLNGSSGFRPENLIAYEIGTRVQVSPRASFSISTFYDVYDHIRTIETAPGGGLPLQFGNLMTGIIYGIEVWGRYQPTDWWQLTAGFNLQQENLRFRPGASQLGGLAFAADDPNGQAQLRSDINLGHGVTWDADLRYVGPLPHPAVPAYVEFNTRVAWAVNERLELSLSGYNLLHPQHIEFFEDGESDEIPRSFLAEARIRF
jgi:iron complex outermembrane receptor protein